MNNLLHEMKRNLVILKNQDASRSFFGFKKRIEHEFHQVHSNLYLKASDFAGAFVGMPLACPNRY
jgi:hypothetical protein